MLCMDPASLTAGLLLLAAGCTMTAGPQPFQDCLDQGGHRFLALQWWLHEGCPLTAASAAATSTNLQPQPTNNIKHLLKHFAG